MVPLTGPAGDVIITLRLLDSLKCVKSSLVSEELSQIQ